MKENDYYGHYKAFVKELNSKPGQTLQIYCRENGVVWRRLYDWMRRHHISLKKLYQTYRSEPKTAVRLTDNADNIEFRELIQGRVNAGQSCLCVDVNVIKGVCLAAVGHNGKSGRLRCRGAVTFDCRTCGKRGGRCSLLTKK